MKLIFLMIALGQIAETMDWNTYTSGILNYYSVFLKGVTNSHLNVRIILGNIKIINK